MSFVQSCMKKGRFWMDDLLCDGSENELSDCRFEGWGKNDCDATEAAGIVCKRESNDVSNDVDYGRQRKKKYHLDKHFRMEVRLTGGRNKYEGRVEVTSSEFLFLFILKNHFSIIRCVFNVIWKEKVRFNKVLKKGHWGSVCGDGWTLLEANVVCKSLGLGYASTATQSEYWDEPQRNLRTLISGTECHGNETDLHDCLHHELGDISCPDRNKQVAGVICTHQMADLVFDHVELERSAHLEDRPLFLLQCAMEENCLATQAYAIQRTQHNWHMVTRRLLKFTATVMNAGNADFRPNIPKHMWEWHMCHM